MNATNLVSISPHFCVVVRIERITFKETKTLNLRPRKMNCCSFVIVKDCNSLVQDTSEKDCNLSVPFSR